MYETEDSLQALLDRQPNRTLLTTQPKELPWPSIFGADERMAITRSVSGSVIATLGRLDVLKETGQLDGLLESLARVSDHVAVLNALTSNQITPSSTTHLGPPLVFERLWKQLGISK